MSNFCPDCGKIMNYLAKRCKKCSYAFHTREKHWNWKGGRCHTTSGHISILYGEHHRADRWGRVLEHIIVWEQTNGKELPKGWIIHHLNGIPDDNTPTNLVALPNKKHYLVLQAKAKRIQELEARLKNQGQLL